MSELKGKEQVDDGDRSWLELLNSVEAPTSSESEKLQKLTQMILPKFVARLVTEMENKMMVEKESLKSCHEAGVEEGKQDYLIGKQKKRKSSDGRKKKQKTNNINNHRKRQDLEKFMELGLEPPPDMPQVFKDCIKDLGGSEIKLIIQKFLQVTNLRSQQNRLSMSLKQIRSTFLHEDEEGMLNAKRQMAVTFIEPCLSVSTVNLAKWNIGSSLSYIINGDYSKVLKNNRDSLKPNAVVQIWSFRVQPNSQLGFALIKVIDGEDGHVID
ncbi:B3 domain-containing protein [Gossypium australe]|uniref:B3 domain-containing protein n=1 Tax=Gossypium australe TaxID=47621 RepID=A0A5B6X2U8_9ROSI|nr:B3 domain-containing protein [Gossypium australe]